MIMTMMVVMMMMMMMIGIAHHNIPYQTINDDEFEPRTVQPSQASWSWSSSGGSSENDSNAKGNSMAVTAGVCTLLVATYQLGLS